MKCHPHHDNNISIINNNSKNNNNCNNFEIQKDRLILVNDLIDKEKEKKNLWFSDFCYSSRVKILKKLKYW